ncbi:MAG: hypothetical protein ACJ8KU_11895 [Chthoniobacterales bacterium]
MASLICLALGLVCAIISRVLLIAAAFSISFWWGIGVLLPFGPILFRLCHRDEAARSRVFGLLSLPCFVGFFALGPGLSTAALHGRGFNVHEIATAKPGGYGTEETRPPATPSVEARRAANQEELARLQAWNEKLRMTKRDLLHSDVEGNRRYTADLAQYTAALATANAEKAELAAAK